VAIGAMERALETAPMRAEGRSPRFFILAQHRNGAEVQSGRRRTPFATYCKAGAFFAWAARLI
jgi:hypothetical protein